MAARALDHLFFRITSSRLSPFLPSRQPVLCTGLINQCPGKKMVFPLRRNWVSGDMTFLSGVLQETIADRSWFKGEIVPGGMPWECRYRGRGGFKHIGGNSGYFCGGHGAQMTKSMTLGRVMRMVTPVSLIVCRGLLPVPSQPQRGTAPERCGGARPQGGAVITPEFPEAALSGRAFRRRSGADSPVPLVFPARKTAAKISSNLACWESKPTVNKSSWAS